MKPATARERRQSDLSEFRPDVLNFFNIMESFWKKCSSCKQPIAWGSKYFLCSVSTCKHPRTGFQFCSTECWDAHLGYVNHRESWAEEKKAPAAK